MARTAAEALTVDYDDAKEYAANYIVILQKQIHKRGLILNGAIEEFNAFLKLSPTKSNTLAIFTAAFDLLCAAVPALRLGKFIERQHTRAQSVLKLAETASETARRKTVQTVTGSLTRIGKVGEHIKEGKEVMEKGAAIPTEVTTAMEELKKHESRGPIKALIKELEDGTNLWMKAKAAVKKEWENRVDDLPPQGGTLLSQMQDLLPSLPATYSPSEFDEIWTLYLFLMISAYCRENVYWKVATTTFGTTGGTFERGRSLVGLNDTQCAHIIRLFGPMASRGKIFDKLMMTIPQFVSQVPIGSRTVNAQIRSR